MRKVLFAIMAMILCMGTASAGIGDKYTIDRDQLPEESREFLNEHFPKSKVGMIKVDKHLLKKTDYDVKLVNGTKIEFNSKGKWTSVDCGNREVPQSVIPRAIRNYIAKNYPDVKVTSIEKKSTGGHEVELSDGVELKFNALGKLKSVDMD